MGVEPKIGGKPPKSSILIGFSMIFTIHFGVPLFLETSKSVYWNAVRLLNLAHIGSGVVVGRPAPIEFQKCSISAFERGLELGSCWKVLEVYSKYHWNPQPSFLVVMPIF